jgi:signal transduction histidine kinase
MDGKITVTMQTVDGHMHFSVKDTGVGIPASDIDKVRFLCDVARVGPVLEQNPV